MIIQKKGNQWLCNLYIPSRIEFIEQYSPEILENIYDGSHVILDTYSNFEIGRAKLNETHCKYDAKDFRQSSDTVVHSSTAWLLNKKSPFKETIMDNLMWMQATGLTNKHYNEEAGLFTKTKMDQFCNKVPSLIDLKKTSCRETGSVHVSIRIKHFRKLFHFYISGNILAFIVFLFEKLYKIMPSISKVSYTCSKWKLWGKTFQTISKALIVSQFVK